MNNRENIKETILGIQEELTRLYNNMKWEEESLSINAGDRALVLFPAMITPGVINSLKTHKINTLSELSKMTEESLFSMNRLGIESIRKLRLLLECHGMRFANG